MLVRQLKSALPTSYERQPKRAWLASCVLLLLLLVRKPKRALRTSHALLLPKRAWLTSCVLLLLLRQLKRACRTSYVLLLLFIQKPKRACIAAAHGREKDELRGCCCSSSIATFVCQLFETLHLPCCAVAAQSTSTLISLAMLDLWQSC